MYNKDLEKLFSPSMWNTRLSPSDVAMNFLKLGAKATLRARKNTRCEIDISYGPSDLMKYDFYGTDLPDDAPIFVFIHGGYWQESSKDVSAFAVENCVSEGIKVFCVGYDLCPKGLYDAGYYSYHTPESSELGVWMGGHSAGAHLTVSSLDTNWLRNEPNSALIKGLVLLSGLYFLEQVIPTSYNEALKLDINEAILMSSLSVPLQTRVPNLKAMVVVGECDSPAFIDQSRRLMESVFGKSGKKQAQYTQTMNFLEYSFHDMLVPILRADSTATAGSFCLWNDAAASIVVFRDTPNVTDLLDNDLYYFIETL